jgi:hypothetical protein
VVASWGVVEPGRFEPGSGEVAEPGRVGGVEGMDAPEEVVEVFGVPVESFIGLTELSLEVLLRASPDIVPLFIDPLFVGAVAEVSTDEPVEALEPALHQSRLARTLGEAFE